MPQKLQRLGFSFFVVLLLAVGCDSGTMSMLVLENEPSTPESTSTTDNGNADSDGLKELFAELQEVIRAGDTATAATITKDLLPDEASLQTVIKGATALEEVKAMHAQFSGASDEQIAALFATDPSRSEIIVHSATTEEIAVYVEGGVAYAEFPGGARDAAESVLQPGVTFYEIELVEPDQDLGMKYHLFYHDGQNWKILGPIWRVLE
jgi:hypothetical protein